MVDGQSDANARIVELAELVTDAADLLHTAPEGCVSMINVRDDLKYFTEWCKRPLKRSAGTKKTPWKESRV